MRAINWICKLQAKTRVAVALAVLVGVGCYHDFVSFGDTKAPAGKQGPPITDDQRAFFEAKIRPVMVKSCYSCHAADAKEVEGGLLLDTRKGLLKGGEDGVVLIPGNVEKSKLIQAIRYTDKELEMPPDDGGGKLPDAAIHDFETWVKMGAPDPREGEAAVVKTYDTTEAKKWWSFQPMKKPDAPHVTDAGWARGEIDQFVLASLEAKSLKPVADADKETLIRRVYFDLTGLPPTPEEVDAFKHDESPKAFEAVVDRLLASPQYGEHWGRHWLDVARYAESSGKDFNVTFPDAWRYRDYVISSFNQDKPYNVFVREQIAGDLLPASDPKKKAEDLVATGFLAIGPKGLDEMVPRQFDLDMADEQVDATSQAFIGLTVSCARCHDHKFDPISQRDYYSMAGIFLSTKTNYGTITSLKNDHQSELIELPASAGLPTVQKNLTSEERDKLKKELADATTEYNELLASRPGPGKAKGQTAVDGVEKVVGLAVEIRNAEGKKAHLESVLDSYDESGKPKALCMGVQDRPAHLGAVEPMKAIVMGPKGNALRRQPSGFETIEDSPLFFRGEMSDPRERVPRGSPAFLDWVKSENIPQNQSGRLELADWIVSPRNPLTARVMANRIWSWLFGQGIVASVDNFGTMGDTPSNAALLDYLANRLIDNGWSVKKTIREIVLSHGYQLASAYDESDYGVDPQNALIWRHSKRRLTAECIRDAMLASSGQLNLSPPVGSAVALAGDGSIGAGPVYARVNEETLINANNDYRSVYLPVARDVAPDSLAVFDYSDASEVTGARETTNVPSQALYLLNNDFVHAQAKLLAGRLIAAYPNGSQTPERVNLAFRLILGREANSFEQQAARTFFAKMPANAAFKANDAWADFCLAIYNTADFRYLN